MADFDDDLGQALRTVAADGRRSPTHSSGADVRRIAQRRQQRLQATGAAFAIVAVLVGVGLALHNSSNAPTTPGHNSPSTPSDSPSPSQSASDTPKVAAAIPASALLTASDLPGTILRHGAYPASMQAKSRAKPDWPCAPAASPGATAKTASFYNSDESGTWIDQRVESFPDEAAAIAATQTIRDNFAQCMSSTSGTKLDSTGQETGLGDEATVYTTEIPNDPNEHAVQLVWLELARTGTVLTWVGFDYATQDNSQLQDLALRDAVGKVCKIGGGACVTEPVVRRTTYAHLPALDATMVTPDQLGTALGDTWQENDQASLEDLSSGCTVSTSPFDHPYDGVVRGWETDLTDTYAPTQVTRSNYTLYEHVWPLASASAVQTAIDRLTAAYQTCKNNQGKPGVQRVGQTLVWYEDDGSLGHRWYAVAGQGSHLITMDITANGDAKLFTEAQLSALLEAATSNLP